MVPESAAAYSRIPFPNNAILSARNTILLHMTCPCMALSYGNITLFQRDCRIYERVQRNIVYNCMFIYIF